jgi:hypothetical protein
MKNLLQISFLIACAAMISLSMPSCANMLPPSGGPRDSLPPRLVSAIPKDSAVNVNVRNIVLSFDEYITLDNWQQNLIVSPLPSIQKPPVVDYKLRNITIKLRDTLLHNTTYSFDFGNAIKDVNEGNIARNQHYVFSTGKTIDYNTYKGTLLEAETGKVDSSMVVILHRNLADSAVSKLRPIYYTRVNGKGEFAFQNLPAGRFAVYAVSNKFSFTYTDSADLFAYRSEPIQIGPDTPIDTLYAFHGYKLAAKPAAITPAKPTGGGRNDKRVLFSTDLQVGEQDLLGNLNLTFNKKLTKFDSTKFVLYDTNYNRINDLHLMLDSTLTKVSITSKWKQGQALLLIIDKEAVADSIGSSLSKTDTIHFNVKRETDYGSIRIRFQNLDSSRNPILQVFLDDKEIESAPVINNEFRRKLYRPGAYQLRILYDTNQNGIWDTGRFFGTKKQPEIVYLIPKKVAIRANWDNEVDISL